MARPRKPSALKDAQGTSRADRRNGNEPEPDLLLDTEPPAHLPERSAAVWREVAPMLARTKVLTVMDTLALEMLCDAVADYRLARTKRGDSLTTTSPKTGSEMLDQLLVAQQMTCKRAENLMSKFGMDPAARSRLLIQPQLGLFDETPAKPTGASRFFPH